MRSWHTTIAGLVLVVGVIVYLAWTQVTNNPPSEEMWGLVGTAFVTGIGLITAKDHAGG